MTTRVAVLYASHQNCFRGSTAIFSEPRKNHHESHGPAWTNIRMELAPAHHDLQTALDAARPKKTEVVLNSVYVNLD